MPYIRDCFNRKVRKEKAAKYSKPIDAKSSVLCRASVAV